MGGGRSSYQSNLTPFARGTLMAYGRSARPSSDDADPAVTGCNTADAIAYPSILRQMTSATAVPATHTIARVSSRAICGNERFVTIGIA